MKLQVHDRNTLRDHTLLSIMEISVTLFDYLADGKCFEFVSLLRKHGFIATREEEDIDSMNDSLVTLTYVTMTSKHINVLASLNQKNIHFK